MQNVVRRCCLCIRFGSVNPVCLINCRTAPERSSIFKATFLIFKVDRKRTAFIEVLQVFPANKPLKVLGKRASMEIGRVQDPAMPERATPNESAISGAERDFSLLARWPSAASPWRGEGGRAGGGGGGGEQSGVPITEPKLCLAGRQNKARGARGERRQRGRELFVPQRAPLDGGDAHARSLQWRLARERAEIAQPMAALAERASERRTGKKKNFPPFENKCVKRCNLG